MSDVFTYPNTFVAGTTAKSSEVNANFDEVRTYTNRAFDLQEGQIINGQITATVGADDLVIRLKTLAGADPSSTSKVYCRIGNTIFTVASALSVTLDDADGDYFDWDTFGIQDNDVQLFVYLINNNGTAQLGVCPCPTLTTVETNYYDAGGQTGSAGYKNIVMSGTRNATNSCQVIGRINAKQEDDNDWISPTTELVINKPIYDTDWLDWTPVYSTSGSMTWTSTSTTEAKYKIYKDISYFVIVTAGTVGGTPSTNLQARLPITPLSANERFGGSVATGGSTIGGFGFISGVTAAFRRYDSGNYTAGSSSIFFEGFYQI